MNIPPDYLLERKNHKNKIRKWKIIAVVLALGIVLTLTNQILPSSSKKQINIVDNYIASVTIEDMILEDEKRDKALNRLVDDDRVKAVIVNINSPGGTVVGAEKIYNILRKISTKKPVVTLMGTLATSGGYLISLGSDYIIAHNGTITGSIGVIVQSAEVTEFAEKLGIKFNNFKTSPFKAAPNPMEKITPEVQEAIMEAIKDPYDYFVDLVAKRRGLTIEQARKVANGKIYFARQALELKLIDAIGSEDDAIKWLQDTRKIDKKLKVKDVKLKAKEKLIDLLLENFESKASSFLKAFLNNVVALS